MVERVTGAGSGPGAILGGGAGGKVPAEGSGGGAPRISRNEFDWGNLIHFSQLSKGRKEQK